MHKSNYSTGPNKLLQFAINCDSNSAALLTVTLGGSYRLGLRRLWIQVIQCSSVNVLPTNSIKAAPSTSPFQLAIVPDQPQIRSSETKPNRNVTVTLILTLILIRTLITLLTPHCNVIGRSVAAWSYWSAAVIYRAVLNCFSLLIVLKLLRVSERIARCRLTKTPE